MPFDAIQRRNEVAGSRLLERLRQPLLLIDGKQHVGLDADDQRLLDSRSA